MFGFFKREPIESVEANEIDKLPGQLNLIDIREPYEYKRGHMKKAKSVPMNILLKQAEKHLESAEKYYIICQTGSRSKGTCRELLKMGYNVINVSGGVRKYQGNLIK